ncbi:unnamed protein product, partial [Laminaria digitata]
KIAEPPPLRDYLAPPLSRDPNSSAAFNTTHRPGPRHHITCMAFAASTRQLRYHLHDQPLTRLPRGPISEVDPLLQESIDIRSTSTPFSSPTSSPPTLHVPEPVADPDIL